jgi:glycosyltransferase involved in cell wall biosynthesis
MMAPQSATATILMATFNGARFIEQQLQSLADQQWNDIDLLVSDDGSQDGTLDILKRWQARWSKGRFEVVGGPQQGFAENFRSLLLRANADAAYTACCDQDDIWRPDKISAAAAALAAEHHRPALYCSRTEYVGEDGTHLGYSPLFQRQPSFRNALVQSMGGGNTIVLNKPALALMAESVRRTGFVSHDWWSYLMVAGAGGHVVYDPLPHIAYRQHGSNLVGENTSIGARLERLRRMFRGGFAEWSARNIAGLSACADLLTPENRALVASFAEARKSSPVGRVRAIMRSGFYRQTLVGNIGLLVQAATGRL